MLSLGVVLEIQNSLKANLESDTVFFLIIYLFIC